MRGIILVLFHDRNIKRSELEPSTLTYGTLTSTQNLISSFSGIFRKSLLISFNMSH